jgi:hypothetical protein
MNISINKEIKLIIKKMIKLIIIAKEKKKEKAN